MRRCPNILAQLFLILLLVTPAMAATYEDGVAAYTLQQYEKAHSIWLELAEAGDWQAQFKLAGLYEFGFGVEQDSAKAAEWYRQAAESGDAQAQFTYAQLLLGGRGVEENKPAAAQWFRRAARQGFSRAQFDLATLYFLGEGVDKDLKEARHWFEMAYNSFPEGAERNAAGDILERLKAQLAEEIES